MRNRFAKRGTPKMKRIIRRTTYSFLTHNWRLTLCLAVIAGLICSMLYVGVNYYNSYTTSWASVSIVYPKIANGTYPDGSRFTLYSLANEENVSAVLDQMHAEGKYRDFDTEDMMRGIRVTAVPAYNKNHDRSACVGYVVEMDGLKLYLAGDTSETDYMPELAKLGLDYAILPTDGVYNMDVE